MFPHNTPSHVMYPLTHPHTHTDHPLPPHTPSIPQIAANAISCTLGWSHIVKLSHTRITHHIKKTNRYGKDHMSTMAILMQIEDTVLDRMKYHLRHELVLYAYALTLIHEQYKRIVEKSKTTKA